MARKKKHEEHVNAEAWAIPYGDLVTLLFALFTVMYAVSSVNEGKFRVLSDSMIAAFNGEPKTIQPVNVGERQPGKGGEKPLVGVAPTALMKDQPKVSPKEDQPPPPTPAKDAEHSPGSLDRMEHAVQESMKPLIDANLLSVRRDKNSLQIEINTDILFPSGAAGFVPPAQAVLDKLAEVLKPFPNPIRVEGHTDDRPVHTAAYPSNWELSAARAASVVHQFTKVGVDPLRLEIVGYGEYRPRQPNALPEGRNANRRVAILVLDTAPPDDRVEPTALEPRLSVKDAPQPAAGAAPAASTVPAASTAPAASSTPAASAVPAASTAPAASSTPATSTVKGTQE
jgi:chemotaxis protein MotB